MPTKAQNASLARILGAVQKSLGSKVAIQLGRNHARSQVRFAVPTGLSVVDHFVLGCGGLPGAKMVEVYGEEGAGKTSFAYSCAARWQDQGGIVQWVDSENGWDEVRAAVFGVIPSGVILVQPSLKDPLGEAFVAMHKAAETAREKDHLLIIWDSLSTSPTREQMEKDATEDVSMRRGSQVKGGTYKLCLLAAEHQVTLLFVNQVYIKIGQSYGSPFTTPGGKGPKFAATARLHLMGGTSVKEGEAHVGKDILIRSDKNRLAPPHREARIRLRYATGWDNDWSTLNHAKDLKLIDEAAKPSPEVLTEARTKLGWPLV